MRIAVTGSIATDHLMTFDGLFSESLVVDQLDKVALSFLVDDLEIRRGGVAANISFGLARLGVTPLLVGSVGRDFDEYRSWLERHGVDCSAVRVSELKHTARFVCTTDRVQAQMASFYTGAMSEAREIELGPLHARDPLDLVLVGANDPEAMLRHSQECRDRGIRFAADPSQQLAWADGATIRRLVDGAHYLFCNDYEAALVGSKTGWTDAEITDRVEVRVTTLGAEGVLVERRGAGQVKVPAVASEHVVDPTGVGDGFRAGFLAATAWGLPDERAAQTGCTLATLVLESVGPQDYVWERGAFLERMVGSYGESAAAEVAAHLPAGR